MWLSRRHPGGVLGGWLAVAAVLALPASASAVGTVSGNVTDTASNALEGICVEVRDELGGPALASTQTAANGDYTVPDVPAGSHKVQFHDCNGGDYVQEFFNDKTDFAQADPVNVADGQDTPDIDAALQPAGHISGHVEDASTSTSIEGICVSASTDPSGFGPPAGNAQTDASGNYDMGGLPAGSYKVTFVDCPQPPADTGGDYVQQWFDGKSSAALADSVNVTVNNTTTGVDASLQPAGHITGNVQDDVTHADLEGICVQAVDAAAPGGTPPQTFAQTDAEGNYDLGGLAPGNWKVNFSDCPFPGDPGGDYVQQWFNSKATQQAADPVAVTAGSDTTNVNASLQPAGHITGQVDDAVTHADLQGICVQAASTAASPGAPPSNFAQTDASGKYDLGGLAPGSYKVGFSDCPFPGDPGGDYVQEFFNDKATQQAADPVPVTAGNTTENIDASLQPAGHISGHVEDANTNAALQGICVQATDASTPGAPPRSFAQTDASGDYDLGGLPAGNYKVGFTDCPFPGDPGGDYVQQFFDNKPSPQTADPVAVAAGATTENIDASLQPAGHVTGHVEDANTNAPLQGICVQATDASTPGGFPLSFAQTDASGDYDLGGLPPGNYRIGFTDCPFPGDPGGDYVQEFFNNKASPQTADPVAVTAGNTTENIDASLQPAGHVTGHVEDANTNADVGGICVQAFDAASPFSPPVGFAMTNGSGDYDLGGLPAGSYKVQFNDCPDFLDPSGGDYVGQFFEGKSSREAADPVAVTVGDTTPNVDASLQPAGHITGHVEHADTNAPLQGVCVAASAVGDPFPAFAGFAQTDASGNYDIGGLPTGSYEVVFGNCPGGNTDVALQFWDHTSQQDQADPVAVTAGLTTPNIDASLEDAAHITGRVTDQTTTNGVENICVAAFVGDDQQVGFHVTTDGNGDYDIGGLPAGTYRVEFSDFCGAGGTYPSEWFDAEPTFEDADPVTVATGGTATGVDATLVQGGHLEGSVAHAGTSAPLEGMCVQLLDGDGNAQLEADTDPDGLWSMNGVPPGTYRIEFGACGDGTFKPQFYDGEATFAAADPVVVAAGDSTKDLDALLEPNAAPVCTDQTGVHAEKDAETQLTLGCTDADGDDLEIELVTQPEHGGAGTDPGGNATYTPDAGYSGPDEFTFMANDGLRESNVATIELEVSDTTGPQTFITSGPAPGSTRSATSIAFAFASDEAGTTFSCRLDAQAAAPCTSPQTYTGLGDAQDHTFTVTASDALGNPDPSPSSRTWHVDTTSTVPPSVAGTAPPGGTVTDDPTGAGPSEGDPVTAAVEVPAGGEVQIAEAAAITTPAPSGFTLVGQQVTITAPAATAADPLRLTFTVDASALGGIAATAVEIYRNGTEVPDCAGTSGDAIPDPCVASRTALAGGDARIVVLTSAASTWNVGRLAPPATGGGTTTPPATEPPPAVATPTPTVVAPAPTPTPNPTPQPTPSRRRCVVPRLRGLTLRRARRAVVRANCRVGRVTRRKAPRRLRGRVVRTRPAARARRAAGTRVAIVVGR